MDNTNPVGEENQVQFLTFNSGTEVYAIPILDIQEIRGRETATRVPNTPGYVQGVVNLRGAIIPVIDLRIRLDMPEREYADEAVLIVLAVKLASATKQMGLLVDSVSDVISVDREDIRSAPDFGGLPNSEFVKGMVEVQGRAVMILDHHGLLWMETSETECA